MDSGNPLFSVSGLEIPFDRIGAEHVRPAVAQLLAGARQAVQSIAGAAPTYAATLGALEDALEPLGRTMAIVNHLEAVRTTPAFREAFNAVEPDVSGFYSSLPLDPGLWRALTAFAATDEARSLDPVRRRHLDKTLDAFRRHGAELDAAGKKELEAIDVELSTVTTRFSQNVLDATHAFDLVVDDPARLEGLPPSAVEAARASAAEKGHAAGWRFTLQGPSVMAVLTYAADRELRRVLWTAYNRRAAGGERDNAALVLRILELRKKKARLLGRRDFADLVLEDRMAKSGEAAAHFVADLERRTRAAFARETEELQRFAGVALEPWDVGYWAEKQRRARYDFDEEALRPYFQADRVLEGLFEVARRLYGVEVEPWQAPVWNRSVRAYRLSDPARGELLGGFYVDLHPREDKRGGAWMAGLVTGGPRPEGFAPHLGLFCANASPPVGGKPALLTHAEVETLFHEFGHLLHHLLSRVPVRSLAGTHVAWDFVELPSQIMENWTWEREALDLFARHWETGEPIPEALFAPMKRARTYRAASAQMRQLGFAATDLALHRDYDPERDGPVLGYALTILRRFAPARLPDDHAMIAAFTHLFGDPVGYGAGYYSYKWAEVLDADAFGRFREEGIFSAKVGRELRERLLSRGDAEDPMALFVAFRGREPSLTALLERSGLEPGA